MPPIDNGDQLVGLNRSNFNAQPGTSEEALCDSMITRVVTLVKAAVDGAAATATTPPAIAAAIGLVWVADRRYKVVAASFVPETALAAADTNFATLAVSVRAPGAAVTTFATNAATGTTQLVASGGVGSMVLTTAWPLKLSATPTVEAGGAICLTIAKSGAGAVVPAGYLVVSLQPF